MRVIFAIILFFLLLLGACLWFFYSVNELSCEYDIESPKLSHKDEQNLLTELSDLLNLTFTVNTRILGYYQLESMDSLICVKLEMIDSDAKVFLENKLFSEVIYKENGYLPRPPKLIWWDAENFNDMFYSASDIDLLPGKSLKLAYRSCCGKTIIYLCYIGI